MSLHTYPNRLLIATGVFSTLLLATSVAVAAYLNAQQAQTADALTENIGSRRAAADLLETLTDLVALHRRGVTDLEALHERALAHLAVIARLADKSEEKVLAAQVAESFADYLARWRTRTGAPGADAASEQLTTQTIPACDRLREFNAHEIETSERAHRAALRLLAGGFVTVGILGSAAGLLFGYGLARGLRRAVDSLLIRLQGASGLLDQELATVEWQRDGRPVPDGPDGLANRVEEVVRRLQQRERDVRQAERLAAVGQFAAGVAHEIRNPLSSVQLLVQMARRDPVAGKLTEDDLALIDDELARIEQSLRTLLDYARPPTLERVPCDLAAVVDGALALIRGRAALQQVEVRAGAPPDALVFNADSAQLRQVFVNLLLNALDAMPTGGTLSITTRRDESAAVVEVTDTGAGIPADILPRLFEPFATGKETGVGLGLVVSRRIVEDHGGTLRGHNQPGGGAAFLVRLPAGR